MEVTKLKFMTKRTQVNYLGDSSNSEDDELDEHVVKKTPAPHPDLINRCNDLIPHLLADASISQGNYKVLEIDFKVNEETESITVSVEKLLTNGRVAKIQFPAVEVKGKLVQIVSDLYDEIEMFVNNEKLAQSQMEFPKDNEKGEFPGEQAEAA